MTVLCGQVTTLKNLIIYYSTEKGGNNMGNLKGIVDSLYWSDIGNVYTSTLNNVNDTIVVHNINDLIALNNLVQLDKLGFADGQPLICLIDATVASEYFYNQVDRDFYGYYNNKYNKLSDLVTTLTEDYTDEIEITNDVGEELTTDSFTLTDNTYLTVETTDTVTIKIETYEDDTVVSSEIIQTSNNLQLLIEYKENTIVTVEYENDATVDVKAYLIETTEETPEENVGE